jgi:hypothetical protein
MPEAANPGVMPPASTQPAAPSAPNTPAPLVNAPVKPAVTSVKPISIAKPPSQSPSQANPIPAHPGHASVPHTAPDPVPPSSEFKTDTHIPSTSPRRYRRGDSGKGKILWIAACVGMTLVMTGLGIVFFNKATEKAEHEKRLSTDPTELVKLLGSGEANERESAVKALKEQGAKAESALKVGTASENSEIAKRSKELLALLSGSGAGHVSATKIGPFPRRLLFIHISKYMFLNPLTASAPGASDKSKPAAFRLAFDWRVPNDKDNNQLFVLSDTAPPEKKQATQVPLKNVVMGAYEQFFDTSRPQDRIVVYFGGHVLEADGKAYIVPVEGDPDDPTSFIPLDDFYAKLNACKATQKVVIWDVCRFNPDRGRTRVAGTNVMTESLAKSLAGAPPGVEVVTTCQPGENALEFYSINVEYDPKIPPFSGSSFLESALYMAAKNKATPSKSPNDPIPIAELVSVVAPRLNKMAANSPGEQKKQTLKLDGKVSSALVPFNAEEAQAKRFDMPNAMTGDQTEINSIIQEFTVPPIKNDTQDTGIGELPFRDEIMKNYKSEVSLNEIENDKEKYKFQARVLEAFQAVRKIWDGGGEKGISSMREVINKSEINDATKKQISKELDVWAESIAKLELISSSLDEIARMKETQSKRWQAHFEYIRAVVKTRLAYMNEYNKLMGDVRTETLPPLDKDKGQNQYRLVSSEKMKSKKDVQKYADDAQEAYNILITEHKGTPWAIQAKREKSFSLGLLWSPAVGPGSDTPP